MCGSEGIVLAKVLPNFLMKYLLLLLITMHGIHASVKPCKDKEVIFNYTEVATSFCCLGVTISTFSKESLMGIEVF